MGIEKKVWIEKKKKQVWIYQKMWIYLRSVNRGKKEEKKEKKTLGLSIGDCVVNAWGLLICCEYLRLLICCEYLRAVDRFLVPLCWYFVNIRGRKGRKEWARGLGREVYFVGMLILLLGCWYAVDTQFYLQFYVVIFRYFRPCWYVILDLLDMLSIQKKKCCWLIHM